ncbi:hypothetical protein BKA70DRAFT_1422075 [Coprinopsis sp. MPI-PUGE-AT-0042]|nr:hypothetical protein BKA70DRAFT_1422075 [Coprinopsis sp. MPI-PUGE-AT-0042]
MAYAVAKGVLATAELFSFASQSSNGFPARLDNRQQVLRRTGPLHDVPQLAVHMQLEEHPSNQPSATRAHIVATGRQSPYPPGFRLPSHAFTGMEDEYRRCLEHLKELGFGFPWKYGRISEKRARCARLLLKHPDIDDHGLAFLRQPAGSEGNSLSSPLLPPSPAPSSDL